MSSIVDHLTEKIQSLPETLQALPEMLQTLPDTLKQLPVSTYVWGGVVLTCFFTVLRALPSNSLEGRVNSRINNYTKFWQKDLHDETAEDNEARLKDYTEVVNGYYDGATLMYEWAWGHKFHFSRFHRGEGFEASAIRHEHYLAAQLNVLPGQRVLDVGCGIGGPARTIANFTGANIVGINNNEYQVNRARRYAKQEGLEKQLTFQVGDFMKLAEQFGENSFDAVYAIEATVHAPSFEGIYSEIYKVLKPGGTFAVYEWVMTEAWDPSIPEHKVVAHGIELGSGIPEMRPLYKARDALKNVGFIIERAEDLANTDDEITWYYPLEGDYSKAQTSWDLLMAFRTSKLGQFMSHNFFRFMDFFHLLPKGTYDVVESLKAAGDALVVGGQTKLFTPMYLAVCKKPMN